MGVGAAQFAPMQSSFAPAPTQIDGSFSQRRIRPCIPFRHALICFISILAAKWDQEFQSQELSLSSTAGAAMLPKEAELVVETPSQSRPHDADELARTAGMLIDTVQNETNPKFKNSAFMGLMRQLRDGDVIVEGNDMVQRVDATGGASLSANAKGKGRAVDISAPAVNSMQLPTLQRPITRPAETTSTAHEQTSEDNGALRQEDPNDTYFRQENEDYIAMQQGFANGWQAPSARMVPQVAEWEAMQRDWDAFEAFAHDIRAPPIYQFQPNNPYLNGEASSRTRHHTSHAGMQETLYEVRRPRLQCLLQILIMIIAPHL